MTMRDSVRLQICQGCGAGDVAPLEQAIDAAGLAGQVSVVTQPCMNGCARPTSLALQGQGRATCFFAGVDPVAHRDDIVATVRAYLAAPGGWIENARQCGRLRFCLVGRVPAL